MKKLMLVLVLLTVNFINSNAFINLASFGTYEPWAQTTGSYDNYGRVSILCSEKYCELVCMFEANKLCTWENGFLDCECCDSRSMIVSISYLDEMHDYAVTQLKNGTDTGEYSKNIKRKVPMFQFLGQLNGSLIQQQTNLLQTQPLQKLTNTNN